MFDLICLGNLALDDVVHPYGETRERCFSGDIIYAVLDGRLWSDQVQFVAPTGSDFPETMMKALQSSGPDCLGMSFRDLPVIRNKMLCGAVSASFSAEEFGGSHMFHVDPSDRCQISI